MRREKEIKFMIDMLEGHCCSGKYCRRCIEAKILKWVLE